MQDRGRHPLLVLNRGDQASVVEGEDLNLAVARPARDHPVALDQVDRSLRPFRLAGHDERSAAIEAQPADPGEIAGVASVDQDASVEPDRGAVIAVLPSDLEPAAAARRGGLETAAGPVANRGDPCRRIVAGPACRDVDGPRGGVLRRPGFRPEQETHEQGTHEPGPGRYARLILET